MASIDLPANTAATLRNVLSLYSEVEEAIIFGSRALGNAKPGSDIDCALSGRQLNQNLVAKIQQHLEEDTLIPHFIDCVHLESIGNPELINHIRRHGLVFYRAEAWQRLQK
jgi:predicted nucleotidyltransferase